MFSILLQLSTFLSISLLGSIYDQNFSFATQKVFTYKAHIDKQSRKNNCLMIKGLRDKELLNKELLNKELLNEHKNNVKSEGASKKCSINANSLKIKFLNYFLINNLGCQRLMN